VCGAYVLAGELVAATGDYATAVADYNHRMQRLTNIARSGNAGPFLEPSYALRIRLRDWTFSNPVLFWTLMKLTDVFATDPNLTECCQPRLRLTLEQLNGMWETQPELPMTLPRASLELGLAGQTPCQALCWRWRIHRSPSCWRVSKAC
jgi:hypothetical protein